MKTYIILNNNKKIKVKNMVLEDNMVSFKLETIYYNVFNSSNTALKEGYFQSWFRKSKKFIFDSETVPTYKVKDNVLTVISKLEEV